MTVPLARWLLPAALLFATACTTGIADPPSEGAHRPQPLPSPLNGEARPASVTPGPEAEGLSPDVRRLIEALLQGAPQATRGMRLAGRAEAVRGTVPVQLPPGDEAEGAASLRTYILASDPVSVPRQALAAAVCAWRYALDLAPPPTVGPVARAAEVAAMADLNLMILPVREAIAPASPPRAFTDAYDHDRARALLRHAGIGEEGLFIVTVSGGAITARGPPPREAMVVETLTGWSPDLVHAWLRETRRRVREPGGWTERNFRQRLLAAANTLDMAGRFVGPLFRLVGVPAAQASAPPLPEPCL